MMRWLIGHATVFYRRVWANLGDGDGQEARPVVHGFQRSWTIIAVFIELNLNKVKIHTHTGGNQILAVAVRNSAIPDYSFSKHLLHADPMEDGRYLKIL